MSAEESRAAFEAHARAQGYGAHLKRHDVGIYESQLIEGMWRGWTAREPEVAAHRVNHESVTAQMRTIAARSVSLRALLRGDKTPITKAALIDTLDAALVIARAIYDDAMTCIPDGQLVDPRAEIMTWPPEEAH